MNRERFSRHLLAAFLLSLALYVVSYWLIESRRVADTPWLVSFQTDPSGRPELEIRQESMHLGPVRIRIDHTNPAPSVQRQEVVFDQPKAVPFAVPLGQCIFQDPTFLPGTVVLEISGVKIQMLPRALTVGTNEFRWSTNNLLVAPPEREVKADPDAT